MIAKKQKTGEQGGSEEQLRGAASAARQSIMVGISGELQKLAKSKRDRKIQLAKVQIYDNIDFVVMQKIYTERRDKLRTDLKCLDETIQSQLKTEVERARSSASADEKEKGEDYYEMLSRAVNNLEASYSDMFKGSSVLVEEFQYVEEMLGPDKPDWETLLDNLAWQMMTNSARYGTDHNFTANTTPFQVFVGEDNPTDEEAELGKPGYKIRADPKQDDTYVINRRRRTPSTCLAWPRWCRSMAIGRDKQAARARAARPRSAAVGEGLQPSKVSRSEHKDRQGVRHVLEQVQVRELRGDWQAASRDVVASEGQDGVGGARRSEAGEAAGGSRLDPLARLSESQPHSVYGSERGDADCSRRRQKAAFCGSQS